MRRKIRILLVGAVVGLTVLYFGAGLSAYLVVGNVRGSCGQHAVNRPDRIIYDDGWPDFDFAAYAIPAYELVRFPSRQPNISIAGWWAEAKPGAPVVILVHGLRGCKNAVEVLVPAGMLWRNGFNVLVIDVRDVGDSDPEDGWTSAGNDESLDVLGAWDWLVSTKGYPPEQIGLFGVSMGGAASLYALEQESRIAALFLEGTFASLLATVADQLTGFGLPGFLAQPAAVVFRLVSHEDIMAHTPIEAIRVAGDRPVYIVHSHGDRRISIDQSQELAAAALDAGGNIKAWFPERSEHLQTPAFYPEEFEQRLVAFFRDSLASD